MQQYADIYLLLSYSTCFGRPSRPSNEDWYGHIWRSLLPR